MRRLPIRAGSLAARLLARLELSGPTPVRTSVLAREFGVTRNRAWTSLRGLQRSGAAAAVRVRYAPERCPCPTCGAVPRGARKGKAETAWLWVPGRYTTWPAPPTSRGWSAEEVAVLRERKSQGATDLAIATELERSVNAVKNAVHRYAAFLKGGG
jgi:hypothetical protein